MSQIIARPPLTDAAANVGSLRTLGTNPQQAAAGNDARLSNARTPTAHAASHGSGGSDALALAYTQVGVIPHVQASSSSSLPSNGVGFQQTTVNFATATERGGDWWSGGVPSRLIVPTTGVYAIYFRAVFNPTGGSSADRGSMRSIEIGVNGSWLAEIETKVIPSYDFQNTIAVATSRFLNANDYLQMRVTGDGTGSNVFNGYASVTWQGQ